MSKELKYKMHLMMIILLQSKCIMIKQSVFIFIVITFDLIMITWWDFSQVELMIYNANWTEWSKTWAEIIRVILKSNERAARVQFEITSIT